MKITNKHTLYGLIIIISMAAIIIGARLIFHSADKKGEPAATNTSGKVPSGNIAEADALIKKADAAHISKQYDEATTLYREARAHYERTNNIEKLAEIDATLSLLEAEKRNTPAPATPELAGER